jgi:hypothetical protein
MSLSSSEAREVPIDVLPPIPAGSEVSRTPDSEPPPPLAGLKTFYHPASGLAILGIDLLFFGPEAIFPPDMAFLCPLAFIVTFPLVYFFQRQWSKNAPSAALAKAFLGAGLAALPFSIVGGIFGAGVIALSGLPSHPLEALKKIPGMFSKLGDKS